MARMRVASRVFQVESETIMAISSMKEIGGLGGVLQMVAIIGLMAVRSILVMSKSCVVPKIIEKDYLFVVFGIEAVKNVRF